ncbi:MAG: hypothetical protein HYR60_16570 [Acidobacteria bacterium]|nr:hypothetical protein [Acidobacteriota bacterium]MBI3471954.1 hypothetical protein [Candidatus Solibacter usitatus]
MRPFAAVTVAASLLLGFAGAPCDHVHEQGGGESHHTTVQSHVHAHAASPDVDGAVFDEIDPAGDARAVTWFQTVAPAGFSLWLAARPPAVPEPVEDTEFLRPAPPVCGHDPPLALHRPSRAPPLPLPA